MTLVEKKQNFRGNIDALEGEPVVVERLQELGFLPGAPIEFLGSTLFGEPLLIRVGNVTVALRKEEAKCIRI